MIKALQKSDHGEIAEDVKLELLKNYSKVMNNVPSAINIAIFFGLNSLLCNLCKCIWLHGGCST